MNSENKFDVIIIGAGAAGLMCAATAGKRGRRVLVLEHNEKASRKILISGGGRCNFTNLLVHADNFISQNPHFCKSALSRFNERDFIALVEKYHIPYHEKTLGQLFCNGKSSEIVEMLLAECAAAGVKIITGRKTGKIEKGNGFTVFTSSGDFRAESLVMATGGPSISKIGATGFGYKIARQFGVKIVEPEPALVPLCWNTEDMKKYSTLSGVSVDSIVECRGKTFRGNILFTHKGLSGPAILQISNYWNAGDEIKINLVPGIDLADEIKEWQQNSPKALLFSLLGSIIPRRVARGFIGLTGYDKPVAGYSTKDIYEVSRLFGEWKVVPAGTEGFDKAEVTRGGIDTGELSSKTFETAKVKGLYFIGEVVDVTGWLGGYNFQWAWSSGYCAGLYV